MMFPRHRTAACAASICLLFALGLVAVPTPAFAGPADQAQQAFDKGEFDKAADLFAKAVKADPKNKAAALGMADAAVKADRQDLYYDALDALAALLKVNEKDLEVQVAMGELNIAIANTKSDPQALKGYFADAQAHFEQGLEIAPKCEAAAAGLARSLYFVGDFPGAIRIIDQFLAREPEDVSKAYFWKGQALYFEAMDTYRSDGHTDAVKDMFRKAQGAYAASAAADATGYDTWLQLGYAAAYAHDPATAGDAYRKAIVADPERSEAALKGIVSLYHYDKPAYTKVLADLVEAHPKNEHVLLYAAFDHYENRRLDEAEPLLQQLVKVAKDPSRGWFYAAKVAEERKDADGAIDAYTKALKANNNYPDAAYAYEVILRKQHSSAGASMATAKKMIEAYEKLFKLAPKDVSVRNNLGFQLRDVWVMHNRSGRDKSWDPILKRGTAAYEEAAELIGEWDDRYATTMPWHQRYSFAQVTSDTGLMFQFHPPIRDLEKAEMYYLRALEYSEDGYLDAWNNLRKIYEEQSRWEDLYDLAEMCADGLVQADRSPNETGRAQARGVMQSLLDSGKVSDN